MKFKTLFYVLGLILVLLFVYLLYKKESPQDKKPEQKKFYKSAMDLQDGTRGDDFTLVLKDSEGNPINGRLNIIQKKHEFNFGGAINPALIKKDSNQKCMEQIDLIFNTVVDESMFKWNKTETEKSKTDFQDNKMITRWAKMNNKNIRHHCLFWSNPEHNPFWMHDLPAQELKQAIFDRIQYTSKEMQEDIESIDVVNEMIAFDFYRKKLGAGIIKEIYKESKKAFSKADLFLNESPPHLCYNSDKCEQFKTKEEYRDFIINGFLNFLDEMKDVPYDKIGLQAHIRSVNDIKPKIMQFYYTNADTIDLYNELINAIAQKTKKKIFITEFDFYATDEKARTKFIENFYRMAFSNENVEGILYWSLGAQNSSIVNRDCKLNQSGAKLNDLINSEWKTEIKNLPIENGQVSFKGFYGDYEIRILEENKVFKLNLGKHSNRKNEIVVE